MKTDRNRDCMHDARSNLVFDRRYPVGIQSDDKCDPVFPKLIGQS